MAIACARAARIELTLNFNFFWPGAWRSSGIAGTSAFQLAARCSTSRSVAIVGTVVCGAQYHAYDDAGRPLAWRGVDFCFWGTLRSHARPSSPVVGMEARPAPGGSDLDPPGAHSLVDLLHLDFSAPGPGARRHHREEFLCLAGAQTRDLEDSDDLDRCLLGILHRLNARGCFPPGGVGVHPRFSRGIRFARPPCCSYLFRRSTPLFISNFEKIPCVRKSLLRIGR